MNLDGLYRMQGMLFSLMILGAFLKKKGIITDEGKRVIADLVIFVTLPCSIIESFEVELSMDILKSSAQALLVSCMVQVACYILNMVLYPGVGEEKKEGSQVRNDGVQCRDSGKSGGGGHLRLDGAFLRLFLPDSAENCDVVSGNDVFYEGAGSEDAD